MENQPQHIKRKTQNKPSMENHQPKPKSSQSCVCYRKRIWTSLLSHHCERNLRKGRTKKRENCVCEREREREREMKDLRGWVEGDLRGERERERERERESDEGFETRGWEECDEREAGSFVKRLGSERGREFERRVLLFGMSDWEKKHEVERYFNKNKNNKK